MAFPELERPLGIEILAVPYPDSANTSGLQGAHIIGSNFWTQNLGWLSTLLNEPGQNTINPDSVMNGVLLPESQAGSASLAAATHSGNHVNAFDSLFYEPGSQTSGKFLNVFERNFDIAFQAAQGNPIQQAAIRAEYRITLMNFLDFVKTQFLSQEILDKYSAQHPGLTALAFNAADARAGSVVFGGMSVANYLNSIQDSFTYENITQNSWYQHIAAVRGNAEINIDRALIADMPDLGRIVYPDGDVIWTKEIQADAAARNTLAIDLKDGDGKIEYDQLNNNLDSPEFTALKSALLEGLDSFPAGQHIGPMTEVQILDQVRELNPGLFVKILSKVLDALTSEAINLFESLPQEWREKILSAVDTFKEFSIDENGVHIPGMPDLDGSVALKIGTALGALAFGGLKVHLAYEKFGGLTPEFYNWVEEQAIGLAVGLPLAAGAIYLLGSNPAGIAVLIGGAAFLGYLETKSIAQDVAQVYSGTAAGDAAVTLLGWMDSFETGLGHVPAFISTAVDQAIAQIPSIQYAAGDTAIIKTETNQLLIGSERAVLVGSDQNDLMVHFGSGEVLGRDGNDTLIAIAPDVLSPTDVLELRGGAGDDWVMAFGGEGARLYGGAGSDLIVGWTGGEELLWGGDGSGADDGAVDYFSISDGSFVMDAGANDQVYWGLFPLYGGVQQSWQEGGWAYWSPFSSLVTSLGPASLVGGGLLTATLFMADILAQASFRYGQTESGQLIVQVGYGTGWQAVIENYDLNLDTLQSTGNIVVYSVDWTKAAEGAIDAYRTLVKLALKSGFGAVAEGVDPLVIDMDRDGVELTRFDYSAARFDLDGDGFAEKAAWVKGDDGFLVRDLNGNGLIDDVSEMFGSQSQPGFAALAALDSNADGAITSADAAFATLKVWRDLDGDGQTDAGELKTLAESGVASISLSSHAPSSASVAGNQVRAEATVTFANGQTSTVADVVLDVDQTDTVWLGDSTVSSAAAALPTLKGYGEVKNLHIAMTEDAALLTLVDSFTDLPVTASWDALKGETQDILFRWAGVDDVAATAMGQGFDRQKLAFLENYLGYELTPRDAQGLPELGNVSELTATWNEVLDGAAIRLAAQGPLHGLLGNLDFDAQADRVFAPSAATLSNAFSAVIAALPADPAAALAQWTASSGPLLKSFGELLVREDGINVKPDYAIASLVKALGATASPLTLGQLAAGLGYDNVQIGSAGADSMNRGAAEGLAIYVGGGGNDVITGGAGQDVYVYGQAFGQDTIIDAEAYGRESGDRIRLAALNPDDVTIKRMGVDLVITVNGTADKITVRDQFKAPDVSWYGSLTSPDQGVEEIQFADGTVYETVDIAAAVGLGTNGAETIVGTAFADEIKGLKGADLLQGGNSGDSYYWTKGDGVDVIDDVMTNPLLPGADVLFVLGGVASDDVTYARSGASDDLEILFGWSGDKITVKGQFAYSPLGYQTKLSLDSRMEAIFLSDGSSVSWIDIQKAVIKASTTEGADSTYGFGTADSFAWSAGNDLLTGFDGADTYAWGRGAGLDVIDDSSKYGDTFISTLVGYQFGQTDAIVFDAGITAADLTFSRAPGSYDLKITIAGESDALTVKNQFKGELLDIFHLLGINWTDRIEEFRFADGSKLTWQQVLALTSSGTAGADVLQGAYYTDRLDGQGGADLLQGYEEGDTYVFGRGYGQDVIDDRNYNSLSTGADVVEFKADVAVGDVVFSHDAESKDLVISIAGTADTLRIKDQYYRYETVFGTLAQGRIEAFRWADGTTKTWSQVRLEYLAGQGTPGTDSVIGTDYDDTLDGGAGDDFLDGRGGADSYVFGLGSGHDTIHVNEGIPLVGMTGDRVLVSAGVAPAEVEVLRGVDEGVQLRITATGDTLTLVDQFKYSFLSYKPNEIETVEFAGGTIWNGHDLRLKALASQSTSGDDTIRGFFSADVITGGLGDDVLAGGDGSDVYRFNLGDGNDRIEESVREITYANEDVLELGAGLLAANAVLTRSGADLVLSFTNAADTVTVAGQFTPFIRESSTDIETIRFADGTVWTDSYIRQRLVAEQQTAGADVVTGFFAGETFDGGAGNDTLRGADGGDVYLYRRGSGQDVIEDLATFNRNQADLVRFEDLTFAEVSFAKVDSDLVISVIGAPTDTLTVKNHFNSFADFSRIEAFRFSDGTTVSYQGANMIVSEPRGDGVTIEGTANADTLLQGTSGDDVIAGRGGDDTIWASAGADRFVYATGDGNDVVRETDSTAVFTDILHLWDINASDVLLDKQGGNDTRITVLATGQTILLKDQISGTDIYGVDRIQFADGDIWDRAEIRDNTLIRGTSGDDVISNQLGAYGYDAGEGNDTITDATDSDRYYWGRGDGNDVITDYEYFTGLADKLILKNIGQQEIGLSRSGNDLVVTILATGETLRIVGQYAHGGTAASNAGVDEIVFAGDQVANPPLTRAAILALTPLSGATGGDGDDALQGTADFNDTLSGGHGADAYLFGRGSGQDIVNDAGVSQSSADRIIFREGVAPSDIQVTRGGTTGTDLIIEILGAADRLTITRGLEPGYNRIESFEFSDGSAWIIAEIEARIIQASATVGNDVIVGLPTDNVIDGGAGADVLRGDLGDDIYVFGRGSGQDLIDEALEIGTDEVRFGPDVAPEDIVLSRSGSMLNIAIAGTSDMLTVQDQFVSSLINGNQFIEQFRFTDGTVWTHLDVQNLLIAQASTAGDDVISGYWTEDVLDGGAGNDLLKGDRWGDIYLFGRGYGQDVIQDTLDTSVNIDEVRFRPGIAEADVGLSRSGNNLVVTIAGASDTLTVLNQFPDDYHQIERFVFADGAQWTAADIRQKFLADGATAGADLIQGFDGNDVIHGYAGDDTLKGSHGDDILWGGLGADFLDGEGGSDQMRGELGDDTYVVGATGDTVVENPDEGTDTVRSSIAYVLGATVENLVLTANAGHSGTGNVLDNAITGDNSANTLYGLEGNDTLNGGGGADQLIGGLGDDTYIIDSADVVVELVDQGSDTVRSNIAYTLGANVENLTLIGTSAINGVGNAMANVIIGNAAANTLDGGLGADQLHGGSGNDIYLLDSLSDSVIENAGEGIDTIQVGFTLTLSANVETLILTGAAAVDGVGNELDNLITGNGAANVLTGGAGADTLDGGLGNDQLVGGLGNDIYIVDNAADVTTEAVGEGTDIVQSAIAWTLAANIENLTLTGASAINGTGNMLDNVIAGNAAVNTLTGGGGNDTLNGGTGADTLNGGLGDDVYLVDNAADVTNEAIGEGVDSIYSSIAWTLAANVENLTLTGATHINGTGNASANTITGNSGNNLLNGAAGADTLIGGLGNDTYVVDDAGDTTTEAGSEGLDLVQSSVTFALAANLENLTLTGAAAINGTGNVLDNVIMGNTGANTLTGGDGNDTLNGGSGADTMIGGLGNDVYVVDNAGDIATEASGEGVDLVQSAVALTLAANFENLTLTGFSAISGTGNALDNIIVGNAAVNTLSGGAGNDRLDGGAGNDTMIGGLGNDTYIVQAAGDITAETAGEGIDAVQSSVTFTLAANVENLTLTGGSAINGTGNALDNIIIGNSAANSLSGGAGNDQLDGGAGNDLLSGAAGSDTFMFASGLGQDTISDFEAGAGVADVISLSLGTAFDSYEEVMAATAQVGADTVITFDASNKITLASILTTSLVVDDFTFA